MTGPDPKDQETPAEISPSIKVMPAVCWMVSCARCGEGEAEHGEHYHHTSAAEALNDVLSYDWRELPDHRLLCLTCWEDGVLDEVACPECGCEVGAACTGPEAFTATHDGRLRAWATANPIGGSNAA